MQQWRRNFQALGDALQSGNLTDAQQAYQTVTQDIQNMQQVQGTHHHHHHHHHVQTAMASSIGTVPDLGPTTSGTSANSIDTTA